MRSTLDARAAIAAAAGASLLASCAGDPSAATESNFEAAINQALAVGDCEPLPRNWDETAPALPVVISNRGDHSLMRTLTSVGAFETKPTKVQRVVIGPVFDGQGRPVMEDATAYVPTERAREYVRTEKAGTQEVASICLGHRRVTAIDNFSEPAERFGYKVSQVSFRYRSFDHPDWAVPIVQDEEGTGEITLVSTAAGWVDAKTLRRSRG